LNKAFGAPSKRRKPLINITSLIDIMFLLLIFFMVSSTFKNQEEAIDITLPQAGTSSAQELDFTELVVSVEGALLFNGEPLSLEDIKAQLKSVMADDPNAQVILRADAEAAWDPIVKVVDLAREVGVRNLVIPTDRPTAVPSTPASP
jgi:biopolymer transport protein ExbD